jgi:REP element-mobilizing transposase RayT
MVSTKMNWPSRKPNRLKNFDYSLNGAYFVTICTEDRQNILSVITIGEDDFPSVKLTPIGIEVEKSITYINENYSDVTIEKFVIMPNHIHLIVVLDQGVVQALSLSDLVGRMKSFTNRRFNQIKGNQNAILWQRSYHDHCIRNEDDYGNIWGYIDQNPMTWLNDDYFED